MPAPWQKWMPLHIEKLWSSSSVQRMSGDAFKGYMALITAQWQSEDCSLPNSMEALAEASRLTDEQWEKSAASILRKFPSIEGGRLRNDPCYELWMEAKARWEEGQLAYEQIKNLRKIAGKAGADKRWQKDSKAIAGPSQSHSTPIAEPKQSDSKPMAKDGFTYTDTVTNTKDKELLASSPTADSAECFISLPTNRRNQEFHILDSHLAEWSELYPAVDVRQQIRNMRGWLDSHPVHRKTLKGTPAFIHRWLGKAQDKATVPLPATGTQSKPFDPCTPKETAPSGITSDQVEQWRRDKEAGKVLPPHIAMAVERIEKREARQ